MTAHDRQTSGSSRDGKNRIRRPGETFDEGVIPELLPQTIDRISNRLTFICYPKCTTCKRAKAYLDGSGVGYEIRDIKSDNPDYEELQELLAVSGLPVKKFFNTSGLLYKELQLKDKLPGMSVDECLKLLATDGMLVKRPILIGYGTVRVGFKQDEWVDIIDYAKRDENARAQRAGEVKRIKGQYEVIVRDLMEGAELLLDMSGFSEKRNRTIVSGYNRSLNHDHARATHYTEKLLGSLADCRCPKKLNSRGLHGDEYRAAESKWMNEAAAEIRRVLDSENDYDFWRTRMPLPV